MQLKSTLTHCPCSLCLALHSSPLMSQSRCQQVSRECPATRPLSLLTALLTCSPDFFVQFMAAFNATQTQPPKGVKRKSGDTDDALANLQRLLAHTTNNDKDNCNKKDNCNEDNKDDEDGSIDTSWINCWIDQPAGEGGHRHREGHPGWGKTEIMQAANIMEDQYNCYMVSFMVILAVDLTDSISPRNPCIICAITTSILRSHSVTTL
jgi:hypothetical protein